MTDECIAIIPARGGSRRVHRKNIRTFAGKPILAHSIACAQQSGLFGRILVSTDDREIASVARHYGAYSLMRAPEYARDEVGTQEVAAHVLEAIGLASGLACVIYPCAPLMRPGDLMRGREALRMHEDHWYAFAVGVNPLRDAGAWYFGEIAAFRAAVPLYAETSIMVPINDERVCDINTHDDWARAEYLHEALQRRDLERQLAGEGDT